MEIYPLNFTDNYVFDGHSIKYSNFIEVAQGGPEVGKLSINGKQIGDNGDYFGGPPVFYHGKMFVPRLKKGVFGRYFKVAVIDLIDLSIKEIGDKEELVLINKVDDSTVYFFDDSPNTKSKSIRWK